MSWKYNNPVKIVFSEYFYKEFSTIIKKNSIVLLLCSNRFKNTENFKKISGNVEIYRIFTEIEENPSFESCKKAIDFALKYKPDVILAIGGGSVIDTAKIVRMSIYRSTNNIENLIDDKIKTINYLPQFIAIPTTHGSSSELTMWATVWDKNNNKKHSISDKINYPDFAIYDPMLFNSLPVDISINTSLDAFSHSFEALWNKNSNPISDDFALNSIKKIVENIGDISNTTSSETRDHLILASIYAGLAFSNTKTAAAHSISYPLTIKYNIPHGIACFMPLFPLIKINGNKIKKKIDKLLSITGFKSIEELWEHLLHNINGKVKTKLRDYKIQKNEIDELVKSSFTKERIGNNIVDLKKIDIKKILNEMY